MLAPCLLVVDAAGQIDERFIPPRVRAMSMAVLTDGVVLVGRSDGEIVSIDPKTGATTDHFASHSASVTDLAIDPRGDFVAAASMDGRVAVWPGEDLRPTELEGAYDAVDFSPDGSQLAVGGRDFRVWILDGKTGATK